MKLNYVKLKQSLAYGIEQWMFSQDCKHWWILTPEQVKSLCDELGEA